MFRCRYCCLRGINKPPPVSRAGACRRLEQPCTPGRTNLGTGFAWHGDERDVFFRPIADMRTGSPLRSIPNVCCDLVAGSADAIVRGESRYASSTYHGPCSSGPRKKARITMMSIPPVLGERGANQAHARRRTSIASAVVAWTSIIFVCPVALLALYALVPNAVELLDRILHYPVAPRGPLTILLVTQVALLTLPAVTFVSWRRDRRGPKPPHRTSKTIPLGCATLVVGLFAYVWTALMVAACPD